VKSSFPIFLAVFVALGASFGGFVIGAISQLGTAKQTEILNGSGVYPVQRTGDATLGLQVYRANGCAACHTTDVRQDGVTCDVVLTGMGKNLRAVEKVLGNFNTNELPKIILHNATKEAADAVSDQITTAGGQVETHIIATGADISRGWGIRRSVAMDFLWDYPVQLGSLRAGPDLANVGARLGNLNWQLQHLYAPQSVIKNSAMPPFHFLFEVRKLNGATLSPDALQLPLTQQPNEFLPPPGCVVIPTEDAKNLVAYLLSLRADVPLYEAPFTPQQTSTNSAAEKK